jgi:two-component sensor histidine kinase
MALIHEKLYRSESLARIDLFEYIRSLTANLFPSYGVSERIIRPLISIEDIELDIDTVIPCALIINELVSNSLKHAFPDYSSRLPESGEIRIELRREARSPLSLLLTGSDNGVGLPEDFEIENCQSLGLKLVSVLARQVKGTIELNRSGQTEFCIRFEAVKP